ncbi:hypothetical protein [Stenotrophomonas sp. BIGb0135]|uniref:hypothetical protein n=1 Tax=Stenotrophomonas sp. BIGb0135 TaxID=2940620 RepID=UPI00216A58C4|nr:hypothetical protein [Stenotrophomonas sp. BIGb0135]MCS4234456.1 hypothetical protein [Stenotrophomonas sp. BIGb0135]
MNKDNAKDYLPLVQALADGKVIQWRDHYGVWRDMEELSYPWPADHYRIKPETKEIWVNQYLDGHMSVHLTEQSAEDCLISGGVTRRHEVIE